MHRYTRTVWLALALASALTMWTASASAGRLSINPRPIRMVWNEMTFRTSSGERVTCAATLEGELEASTFAKVINLRMGVINSAASGCSSTIRFLTETSWDIRYETFLGTLPEIRNLSVKITGFAFRWIGWLYDCLYRSEINRPIPIYATRNLETAQLTRVDFSIAARLPPIIGASCRAERDEVALSGSGTISRRGEGEGIFVNLIA